MIFLDFRSGQKCSSKRHFFREKTRGKMTKEKIDRRWRRKNSALPLTLAGGRLPLDSESSAESYRGYTSQPKKQDARGFYTRLSHQSQGLL
jgi:hypothetical protein